jgi:hypothetical protein
MIVYVNGVMVSLYRGMKVKHALSPDQLEAVRVGSREVRDHAGNVVGLEGSLTEGSHLYMCERESASEDADSPPPSSRKDPI